MIEYSGYLALIAMGTTLGLLGTGGAILTVPILVYLFGLQPVLATWYSLFIVGLTAMVGSYRYIKLRYVDFGVGVRFMIPATVGMYVARTFLLPSVPPQINLLGFDLSKDQIIMVVFASMLLRAGSAMVKSRNQKPLNLSGGVLPQIGFFLRAVVVGLIAGFIGAGGGFLIVPALVFFAGLEIKNAIATSLFVICLNSFAGFFSDFVLEKTPHWEFLFIISGFALVGVVIGTAISEKIPKEKLKPAFGWFVVTMGLLILLKQFS